MRYESFPTMDVIRDDDGTVRQLDHLRAPFVTPEGNEGLAPLDLSRVYLQQFGAMYEVAPSMLEGVFLEPTDAPDETGSQLRLSTTQEAFEMTIVQYAQTYFGLPVWSSGITIAIADNSMSVFGSTSSLRFDVALDRPGDEVIKAANAIDSAALVKILQLDPAKITGKDEPRINRKRLLIYAYDPEQRFDPELTHRHGDEFEPRPVTLQLPPVPKSISAGSYYVVQEVFFTLSWDGTNGLNWVVFIEVNTGAVLMIRALIASATASVYRQDPPEQGAPGTVTALSSDATLNPYRSSVTLQGLPAPSGSPLTQTLTSNSNEFVKLQDFQTPTDAPPTALSPFDFTANVSSGAFAAATTYYSADRVFRYVRDLIGAASFSSLFDGTTFPVHVDHRAEGGAVNAHGLGNGTSTGSDGFTFGVCDTGSSVGIAAENGVVWHEFGHAILWDALHSPNFGFSHSCGDSFAAIMNDPDSLASDRFLTFPFIPAVPRRHDRPVSTWAWGGGFPNDDGGYGSEQILSTTLFRIYRSMGGDDGDYSRKILARDFLMYLIVRAIAAFGVGGGATPTAFSSGVQTADTTTTIWNGHVGGAYNKVVRWGFEKQGLYQLPGTPTPYTAAGAPPAIDVYIDDGRGGEYPFQPNWWSNTNIWNRHAADGLTGNQDPNLHVTNYVYVRVQNRGQNTATNVVVKSFFTHSNTGLVWPTAWIPMSPAFINAPNVPPLGSIVVGPFAWTPTAASPTHECLLAYVKSDGDPTNAETIFGGGPIPEWRLVPHDNNIGQRNLNAVAGLHGGLSLFDHFSRAVLLVNNPFDRAASVKLVAQMPQFLVDRQWDVDYTDPPGGIFTLESGQEITVSMTLRQGAQFTVDEIPQEPENRQIIISVIADPLNEVEGQPLGGGVIGGVTYEIDPTMDVPGPQG
ncbi:MAG: hypothetical protein JST22_00545 [Bacteroidetes bacterium]|nr:hypothetical protein [Bacteroidota bacterium]